MLEAAPPPARDLYFIAEGKVRVIIRSTGGHEILNELGPGQSVREIASVDGGLRSAGVLALTSARILLAAEVAASFRDATGS